MCEWLLLWFGCLLHTSLAVATSARMRSRQRLLLRECCAAFPSRLVAQQDAKDWEQSHRSFKVPCETQLALEAFAVGLSSAALQAAPQTVQGTVH